MTGILLTQLFYHFIGEIGLIDYDDVEVSNLPRQILHPENNVGLSKVDSAENELKR